MKHASRFDEEKKKIQEKMTNTEKMILKLEKVVHKQLRFRDLYDKLTDAASLLVDKHPNLLEFVEAKTQADTVIFY